MEDQTHLGFLDSVELHAAMCEHRKSRPSFWTHFLLFPDSHIPALQEASEAGPYTEYISGYMSTFYPQAPQIVSLY